MIYIPRPEHPDPQCERADWLNLNGEWDFEFDFGNSKLESGILDKKDWEKKILVPFCPESKLSGIEYTDFISAVWYRRNIEITAAQLAGRVVRLAALAVAFYLFDATKIAPVSVITSVKTGLFGLALQWTMIPLTLFYVESLTKHE